MKTAASDDGGGCAALLCFVNAVMLKGIQDGGFLVVGADADLSFWLLHLVVPIVKLDTQLVPHLGNVEGVDIEAVFLFNIGLNVGIGCDETRVFP